MASETCRSRRVLGKWTNNDGVAIGPMSQRWQLLRRKRTSQRLPNRRTLLDKCALDAKVALHGAQQ